MNCILSLHMRWPALNPLPALHAPAAGAAVVAAGDPSVLRFLIAAREEVDSTQLRDDLLSMLVAGHETTGSALTWTLYLLAQNPDKMAKAQVPAVSAQFNTL